MRVVRAAGFSLLQNRTHYHAKLWKIERTDGVAKHLTNHDRAIQFDSSRPFGIAGADVQLYVPAIDSSASDRSGGLEATNKELKGTITTTEITEADVHTGLYKDAKITEFLVDYRFPMLSPITKDEYFVAEIVQGQDIHEWKVEGVSRVLGHPSGPIVTRRCPYQLGDSNCKKDLTNMQRLAVVVDTVTDRSIFTATAGSLPEDTPNNEPDLRDGYFALGELRWKTGSNAGVVSTVAQFTLSTRTFVIRIPTPNDIDAGDTFDVDPGDDKSISTCDQHFNNKVNFGGDNFVPGISQTLKGPEPP